MSFVTATNRILFSSRLFFAAFLLIAMAGLALGESAALSDSYRQIVLSVTAGVCVAMAFAALVLELLERAERLETHGPNCGPLLLRIVRAGTLNTYSPSSDSGRGPEDRGPKTEDGPQPPDVGSLATSSATPEVIGPVGS